MCALALTALSIASSVAEAGSREQAKRIFDRLAGVPADEATIDALQAAIDGGGGSDAAKIAAAMQAMNNPAFYSVTLKNFVTPWTNRDANVFAPLNDYTATIIGMVRDDIDFRKALYDDIIYVAQGVPGAPAYSNSNNDHYEYLENNHADLKASLVQRTQSATTSLRAEATAGIMTTRAAAKAFFIDGTNRAMFRYTLLNHLCNDLEQVKDITRVSDRIRQDVTRSPGGDSRLFNNTCIGCHSGMDPMAQSLAYYDFVHTVDDELGDAGSLSYNDVGMTDPFTGTRVKKKYHINENNFKYGFVTPDDKWDNYWRAGQNQVLGWDPNLPGSGSGAKSMGQELAYSEAFAECQVKKVFKAVCLRNPVDSADRNRIDSMTTSFKNSGYKMKQVFAETASYCAGN
ncbi:hypothetical protein HPT27_09575 [Permianibacter sp. IMCC34836]|nr:hypothetical protein [Permianibacter fluminis]